MELPDFIQIPSIIIKDKDLQPLDGLVYGVIYWYVHLKLQKCILSNSSIAKLLGVSLSGVAHALSRLAKKEYIEILLDEKNHRIEIIPLVSFKKSPLSDPLHNQASPLAETSKAPSSNEQHNNIDIKREINNTVNGRKKNGIFNVPKMGIEKDYIDYLIGEILKVTKDDHSRSYYEAVAERIPEHVWRPWLSEAKQEGESPKKLFVHKVQEYLQNKKLIIAV